MDKEPFNESTFGQEGIHMLDPDGSHESELLHFVRTSNHFKGRQDWSLVVGNKDGSHGYISHENQPIVRPVIHVTPEPNIVPNYVPETSTHELCVSPFFQG